MIRKRYNIMKRWSPGIGNYPVIDLIIYQRVLYGCNKGITAYDMAQPPVAWYNKENDLIERMKSMKVMVVKEFDFSKLEELDYTYNEMDGGYVSPDKSTIVMDGRSGPKNVVLLFKDEAEAEFDRNVEELSQLGYLYRPLELSSRTRFEIDNEKIGDAFDALREAAKNSETFPSRDSILGSDTLQEALKDKLVLGEVFFELRLDAMKNKMLELNDKPIFDVLAPFIYEGYFIEFWLENKHLRRWVFDGSKCVTSYCKMEWTEAQE